MGFQDRLNKIAVYPADSGNPAAPALPLPVFAEGGLARVAVSVPSNGTAAALAAPPAGRANRLHSWSPAGGIFSTTGYVAMQDGTDGIAAMAAGAACPGFQLLGGVLVPGIVYVTNATPGVLTVYLSYDVVAAPFS